MSEPPPTRELTKTFAALWEDTETSPDVFAFLEAHPQATLEEQTEMLLLDQAKRWERGVGLLVEDYLEKCPHLAAEDAVVLALLAGEHRQLQQRGQQWELDSLSQRFPRLSESQLREVLEQRAQQRRGARHEDSEPAAGDETLTYNASTAKGSRAAQGFFADYELLEEIAHGGMGVVYKARQTKLNRVVAIKMILSGQLASEDEVRRFYAEAEAAARLDHPNIVPIYQVGQHEGHHFFSMGFVEGKSLAAKLSEGPLTPREAAELVLKCAQAMAYAHERGVIHRDLKPSNILLDEVGQPQVADFGLAKRVEAGNELTTTGQVLGTPSYMSPEQAAGKVDQVGPLSDVYSLAAMLYALLTGRPPFQSASVVGTLKQVVEAEPVPPRRLNDHVPRDLETICLKGMAKEPDRRYASAQELADDLERWLNDEPIKARPIGRIERGWRWVKRNPRVASLTAAVLLLLTAMGVGAAVAVLRVNMAQRRTAEAERDVARTGALAAMTHSLEIGLDADQWDAEHLEAMESMIADLEKLKPDEAADARRRLIERFAAHIKSRINQPKLTTAQVSDSEGLLTLLAARDKQSSESLRVLLAQRLASWQPVFSLQAPFDEWTAVFHPGRVSMQDESLIRKTPGKKSESQVEFTLVKSGSQAQLEATFDASWQKTKIIGLRLNASQNSSYTFVVRPAGKSLAAEIRKNGITLRRVEFSPQDVSKNEKELTLRAERDRTRLVFQINDQRQLEVEDVFPLSAANQGVYALHWPSGVGLRRLVAQHKTAPDNPSPLERGDELYDAGRFAEALTRFQNQAARSGGSAFAHQARYKAGLCLLALNRTPEAVAMFDRLYPEAGDRWAALAGCQLWSLRLREKKYDEADVLFKSLSSKFRFRDLLVLLPHSLRTEILKEYREGYRDFSYQLSHDPKRLERLKRAVEIEAELVDNPRARAITKKHLLRAHRMQGNLNEAIRIAETIVREIPLEAQFLYEYTWLLRLRGADNDLPHAHAKIVELLYERPGVYRKGYVGLLVERARIQAALNHSYLALQNLREYLAWAPTFSDHGQSYYGSAAFLLHGLLREQAGERAAAYEIWRQGAQNVEECARANVPTSHSTLLRFAILGSLSGDLSDSAALWITSRTTGGKDDLLSAIVRELPEDPAERAPLCGGVIRNMWRSRHGMRFMEKFARQSNTLAERYQAPVSLALAEIARQFAFGGGTTPEEAEILWQAASGLQAAFAAGELGKPQMTQLFHTWRGISDDNGWASLSKAVKPELLGPLAYVLAQRCLHMKLPDPARELLETARRNAKPGSALEKLAVRSLALLESDNGLVRVHNAFPKKIEITLRSGDKTQSVEAAAGTQDVKVAAGTHEITFAPPREDGAVSRRTITVRPAQAITLQVRPLWKPAENSPRWPGPIALPAKLPNVSRWQACLKYPSTEIRALAASPDGRVVAAAGRHDPIVRVYDVASGKLVVVLVGHEMEITALAWSPDGRLLASGSRDATIRLWRMPSGRLQAIVPALSGISTMAWRPDGRQLATANWGRVIQIWGTDGALQQELPDHDEIVLHLSWSPDGKWLASSSVTKTLFRRPGQAAPAAQLLGDAPTQFATFSPEGKRLSAIVNNALTLWDSATWKQLHAFPAHPNYVRASAWAPDGNRIAVASDDHRITVWDTQRLANEPLASTVVHSQRCIDWGPKADSFVTGDSKAAIRVWTPDGKVQRQIGSPSRRINQLAWQPRGDLLAVACLDQRVRLVGRTKLQCVVLPIERGYVTGLVWRDEGHLAGSCDDGFVRLWNVADGKLVATSPKHSAPVQEVAQMPSGEFVSVARGAEVVLWRTTDQGLKPLGKPQGWPADVTVSPQGRVALALNHSKIWLWDSPASQSTSWDVGKGKVVAVAWRPSGDQLAVGSGATVTLLNSKGEIVATAQKHRSEVRCLAWSPSGELLASGSSDGMVRVWDRALNQQFVLLGDLGSIRTIAWNSQGTKLAFAGTAPVVKFCNVRTRTIEKTTFLLPEDQLAHFNTAGGPLALSPQADEHLIYVVERPNGEKELMAPSRFNQEARANFSPLQEAKRHRLLPPPRNTGQPAG